MSEVEQQQSPCARSVSRACMPGVKVVTHAEYHSGMTQHGTPVGDVVPMAEINRPDELLRIMQSIRVSP